MSDRNKYVDILYVVCRLRIHVDIVVYFENGSFVNSIVVNHAESNLLQMYISLSKVFTSVYFTPKPFTSVLFIQHLFTNEVFSCI